MARTDTNHLLHLSRSLAVTVHCARCTAQQWSRCVPLHVHLDLICFRRLREWFRHESHRMVKCQKWKIYVTMSKLASTKCRTDVLRRRGLVGRKRQKANGRRTEGSNLFSARTVYKLTEYMQWFFFRLSQIANTPHHRLSRLRFAGVPSIVQCHKPQPIQISNWMKMKSLPRSVLGNYTI